MYEYVYEIRKVITVDRKLLILSASKICRNYAAEMDKVTSWIKPRVDRTIIHSIVTGKT